jgi:UDP-glucose 4-epimerase
MIHPRFPGVCDEMAVLVTGGAGYIGSHMVLRLLDAGEEVVVLDDLSTGFAWAVDGRATLISGDAGDMPLVDRVIRDHRVAEIIHFAGSLLVGESVSEPLKYYANNVATSRNLVEAALKGGVRHFVFSSSAAVYGMTGMAQVGEEAPLNPVSPYGRTKLVTEWMLADVASVHPITYGALRYFNVAGADPGGRSGESTLSATHLVKAAAQAALGRRPYLSIFGTDYPTPDGTCVRDYIHVTDLVDAHALLLQHLRRGGRSVTLNCGYGRGYSVRQVIETMRQVSGAHFEIREMERRAGDPAAIVARAERVREVIGWRPRHDDLETIVASALSWERHLMQRG